MQKTTKTVYITSDKQEFASEAEAQAHEIECIEAADAFGAELGKWIVANKDTILSILGARRRVRSDKGKKRQKAEVANV